MPKKTNFGPDFGPCGPNLSSQTFFVSFTSTECSTLSRAVIVCNFKENLWSKLKDITKNLILAWFIPVGPKFCQSTIFFFFWKVWPRKSVDIMVSYHSVEYQENLTIQSWEKLVIDGQTDGRQMGRQTKGRGWFHRLSGVERPIINK